MDNIEKFSPNVAVLTQSSEGQSALIGQTLNFTEREEVTLTELLEEPTLPGVTDATIQAVRAKKLVDDSDSRRQHKPVEVFYTPSPFAGTVQTAKGILLNVEKQERGIRSVKLLDDQNNVVVIDSPHKIQIGGLLQSGDVTDHQVDLRKRGSGKGFYLQSTDRLSLIEPISNMPGPEVLSYTFREEEEEGKVVLTPTCFISNKTGEPLDIALSLLIQKPIVFGSLYRPEVKLYEEAIGEQIPITWLDPKTTQVEADSGALATSDAPIPSGGRLYDTLQVEVQGTRSESRSWHEKSVCSFASLESVVNKFADSPEEDRVVPPEITVRGNEISYEGRIGLAPGINPVVLDDIEVSGRSISLATINLHGTGTFEEANKTYDKVQRSVPTGGEVSHQGSRYQVDVANVLFVDPDKPIPSGALYFLDNGFKPTQIPLGPCKSGDGEHVIPLMQDKSLECYIVASNVQNDPDFHKVDYEVLCVNTSSKQRDLHLRPNYPQHYTLSNPASEEGDLVKEKILRTKGGKYEAFAVPLEANSKRQITFSVHFSRK